MVTIIVGAGVIGASIALELRSRGRDVLLLERDEPARGASFGNMASIAVTEFMPMSRPAIWKKIPGWTLDREGPVSVRPGYAPRAVPWFVRFLAASQPSRVRELEDAGAALAGRVHADLERLLARLGLSGDLSEKGCLALYRGEVEFRADREHIDMLERYALPHSVLDRGTLHDIEPEVSPEFERALLLPDKRRLRDPYALVMAMVAAFRELGGRMETGNVAGFERSADRVIAIRLGDGRRLPADEVVVCAGAHSGRLMSLLGDPIPLESERGYHTHIKAPGISLDHSLIWPARGFMVTPTAGGIRVGGTVEIAGLKAEPDYRRARAIARHATQALPRLRIENATEWMGHRPALPDTIPVISASVRTKGAFYATGHGHLGLTYAATTARLLADLVTQAVPPIDMRPYRVDRFASLRPRREHGRADPAPTGR